MLFIKIIGLVILFYGTYRLFNPLLYGAGGLIDYKDMALILFGFVLVVLGGLL